MEQQTIRKHKKPMYILSLDNNRIFWLLTIAFLVFVFLFLLGYWIGQDTRSPEGNSGEEPYQSRLQNDLLSLRKDLKNGDDSPSFSDTPELNDNNRSSMGKKDSGADASGQETERSSGVNTESPGSDSMPSQGERKNLTARDLASSDEQKEFESLIQKTSGTKKSSKENSGSAARKQASTKESTKESARESARESTKESGSQKSTKKSTKNSPSPTPDRTSSGGSADTRLPEKADRHSGEPVYTSGGDYAVQVASLGSRATADKTAGRLSKKGYRTYVTSARVDGKQYYRVKVGNFSAYSAAKDVMRKLRKLSMGRESFVVKN